MFKIAICLLALATGALSASIGQVSSTTEKREIVPVLKFETDKQPDGSFHFSYEGGDMSMRSEQGVIENAGTEDEALEVSGMYSYIDADGNTVVVNYTAGKNGFVPVGTIIPAEITALAKAAADLPKVSEEEELKYKSRRSRSQDVPKEAAAVEKKDAVVAKEKKDAVVATVEKKDAVVAVEKKDAVVAVEKKDAVVAKESVVVAKSEPLPAASQVVPVQVVLESEVKAAPAAVAPKEVETKTA